MYSEGCSLHLLEIIDNNSIHNKAHAYLKLKLYYTVFANLLCIAIAFYFS